MVRPTLPTTQLLQLMMPKKTCAKQIEADLKNQSLSLPDANVSKLYLYLKLIISVIIIDLLEICLIKGTEVCKVF